MHMHESRAGRAGRATLLRFLKPSEEEHWQSQAKRRSQMASKHVPNFKQNWNLEKIANEMARNKIE